MSANRKASRIWVGSCGFAYPEWSGLVYPAGLAASKRLTAYAQQFSLLELDSTYYGTPPRDRVARWAEQTPADFTITAKVPKQITQDARLAPSAAGELAAFLETMRLLGPRLGPLVFQMSPGFRYPRDFASLGRTLAALPELGGEGLRFAVEFRHPSWLESDEPEALLRAHGVAWVWNDWLPTEDYLSPMPRAIDEPAVRKVTADDFAYVRLVGNHNECVDNRTVTVDRAADLVRWAELVLEFRRSREERGVYVLMNNHYSGASPTTIRTLEQLLGLPVVPFGGPTGGPTGGDADGAPGEPERPRLPGL